MDCASAAKACEGRLYDSLRTISSLSFHSCSARTGSRPYADAFPTLAIGIRYAALHENWNQRLAKLAAVNTNLRSCSSTSGLVAAQICVLAPSNGVMAMYEDSHAMRC